MKPVAFPDTAMPVRPIARQVAAQAAEWFVLLQAGNATPADHRRFDAWLAAEAEHARAWQRAQQVSRHAGSLPPALGTPALGRHNRRDATRVLLLLMTAAPAGWLAWHVAPWPSWTATHATTTGERREVMLPDGTRIQLDTASAIDVAYDDTQRLVMLREGAVLIETAPDHGTAPGRPARPFLVRTAQGSARAIGTRFIVRQAPRSSHVAVLQGAVELTTQNGRAVQLLRAGEQAGFDGARIEAVRANDAATGQWARGVLAVDDMRLDDFLAELGRYRPGLLRCDPAVASLRITGAFQLGDTDAVLMNVAHLLPVQLLYRTRYWVTVMALEAGT